MDAKTQFQRNATVLSAQGNPVGLIERVVVNPETNVLTDIVVRTGTLLKQGEKVVPIELVDETADSQIVLREEAGELEGCRPFEERRLIDENPDPPASTETEPAVIVGYPTLGAPLTTPPNDHIATRIEQNIPVGTVAMKEGAKVVTAEGKHVGNVERVLVDPSVDQITHLLVSKGLLLKEAKLIPIVWVMALGEDKVHLRVKKDAIESLQPVPMF
jgi:uncharacterized protein YrrD